MLPAMAQTKNRFDYSYIILGAGFLILFFSSGTRMAFGLVLVPMTKDLDISRSVLSSAFTVFMVVSAIAMPVVGRLIDLYSIRVIIAVSTVIGATAFALMGQVTSSWHLFVLYGFVFAVGHAGSSIAPISVLMSRWFPERRGFAASVAISGNGTGQLVIIVLMTAFLESLGWRMSYAILGAVNAVVVLPVALAIVQSYPSTTMPKKTENITQSEASVHSTSLVEVIRSREFLLLMVMFGVCGAQDFFMATHVVAFAQDMGLSQRLSGNVLAFMGLLGLVGVLFAGVMSDKLGASKPTLLCYLIRIGLFAYISVFQDTLSIATFALIYGFTFTMTAPLTVVFISNIFGTSRLGTLSGLINMIHQVFGGIGAVLGAAIFDSRGSYDIAFLIMLILSIVAVLAVVILRERPNTVKSPCG